MEYTKRKDIRGAWQYMENDGLFCEKQQIIVQTIKNYASAL
jgi:hypothetical protein